MKGADKMNLGNQIYELRKKSNLSQEQLAEKVGVTRQTISKWELGETSPDIRQAQALSRIFGISLDELTGNETKEMIYEKVSNTEKLAGIVIKILKVLGILISVSVVVTIISVILIICLRQSNAVDTLGIEEYVGDSSYSIEIGTDGTFNTYGISPKVKEDLLDMVDFNDLEKSEQNIRQYFEELRGETE